MTHIDPTIAEEAIRLVNGDRQNAYGHFTINMANTAHGWTAITGTPLNGIHAALGMAWLKIARTANNQYHRDNYVDAIAYLLIAAALQEEQCKPSASSSPQPPSSPPQLFGSIV